MRARLSLVGSNLDAHAEIRNAFQRHREALMAVRIASARRRFEAFVRALRAHMRHEERDLLPIYARLPQPVGGGIDLILAEHRRMLQFIRRVRRALRRRRWTRADALRLVDGEWIFAQLLDQHDRRERRCLYPALDRSTSPAEKARLLQMSLLDS